MTSDYSDFRCVVKNDNNELIVTWAYLYLGSGHRYALVLDGPRVGTSSALIRGNVSIPSMIYAPQFNDEDADKMERTKKCVVIRSTLARAISYDLKDGIPHHILQKIAVFNLDFMGSIFGRKACGSKSEIYPLSDFYDCLRLTDEKEIIISITVSERMGPMTREQKYFDDRVGDFGAQIHKDFLVPVINFNQYLVIKSKRQRYRRVQNAKVGAAMWFFIYYLRKDLRIDPSTVKFAKNPDDESLYWGFNPDFEDSKVQEE